MKATPKSCVEQDKPYITKFPELRWNPAKWKHVISEPQPPDLLRRTDGFVTFWLRWWGLNKLFH